MKPEQIKPTIEKYKEAGDLNDLLHTLTIYCYQNGLEGTKFSIGRLKKKWAEVKKERTLGLISDIELDLKRTEIFNKIMNLKFLINEQESGENLEG